MQMGFVRQLPSTMPSVVSKVTCHGATVAAINGGVTASGAALIDLMSFLTQGRQTENERDDVLPS